MRSFLDNKSPVNPAVALKEISAARARTNGPSFLLGWLFGLSLVCLIVSLIADSLDVGIDSSASDGASTLKVALGVVLVLMAIRRWRGRPVTGAEIEMPKWMVAIGRRRHSTDGSPGCRQTTPR